MTAAGLAVGAALALVLLLRSLSGALREPAGGRPPVLLTAAAALLAGGFGGLSVAQLADFLR